MLMCSSRERSAGMADGWSFCWDGGSLLSRSASANSRADGFRPVSFGFFMAKERLSTDGCQELVDTIPHTLDLFAGRR